MTVMNEVIYDERLRLGAILIPIFVAIMVAIALVRRFRRRR
jgi:hypothetical protein